MIFCFLSPEAVVFCFVRHYLRACQIIFKNNFSTLKVSEQQRQLGDTWSAESFVRSLEGSHHIYHCHIYHRHIYHRHHNYHRHIYHRHIYHRHNYDDYTHGYNDDRVDLIKGGRKGGMFVVNPIFFAGFLLSGEIFIQFDFPIVFNFNDFNVFQMRQHLQTLPL